MTIKYLSIFALVFVFACTDIERNHGVQLRPTALNEVTANSSKQDVLRAIGSPSTKSTFGNEVWYYINNRAEKQIIDDDDILEQNILAISFDEEGFISNIELFDVADSQNFAFSERQTPTAGHDLTVVEQLLGNLGRFNAAGGGLPGGGS